MATAEQPPSTSSLVQHKKKGNCSKNNGLKNCFNALVDRKQVNLELDVLRIMLIKELGIQLDTLEPELASTLPYLLVHFIKTWPGWLRSSEYYSGKITFKAWFDKFFKYMMFKLTEAMHIHYKEIKEEHKSRELAEVEKKYADKKLCERNTQTDSLAPKAIAPFKIDITAKPEFLNTIVFTDTAEGDVLLKQHKALEWDPNHLNTITLKQLITWPHVGVHLKCPIFTIVRKNFQVFDRQLSIVGTPIPSIDTDFISEMKMVSSDVPRKAYSLQYMRDFKEQFVDALKTVYSNRIIVQSFDTVIEEFLMDIEEIDCRRNGQKSIGTNTSVLFNIGKFFYFRNKKISKGSASRQDLAYIEVVKPQMEIILQMGDEVEIDKYLMYMKMFSGDGTAVAGQFALPQITFSCTYCNEFFEKSKDIVDHLKNDHKMDRPLLCTKCKLLFKPFELTKNRWRHECKITA